MKQVRAGALIHASMCMHMDTRAFPVKTLSAAPRACRRRGVTVGPETGLGPGPVAAVRTPDP